MDDWHNKTNQLFSDHQGQLQSLGGVVDGNLTDPNLPPRVTGLDFLPRQPAGQDNSNLNVIIPAVACFCFGIFIAALIAFFVYRKQKRRWKENRETTYFQNEAATVAMKNQKYALFQNDPLGDFFQTKEGTVSQDAQSALNFLATPFVCNSFSDSKTNFSPREQALLSLENEIDRETRGAGVRGVRGGGGSPANPPGRLDWSLPDSDVVVNIPAGTLPRSTGSSQNSLKVALGANPLNVARRNDQIQLSPLLILSSPNVVRFNKSIEVRIPHRAHLTTESAWTMQLRYSGTTQNNINKLDWSDGTQDMHNINTDADVTYRYDTDFVYVSSYVPGLFCVVGSGASKKKPLKVAAMVFAYPLPPQTCEPEPGQETGNCGVDIKVFFIDNFREAIQHLRKTEEEAGGLCISEPLPVRMVNEKDWQVILVSADTPHWPYRIHDGERVKVLPSAALYKDFGLGVSVDFRIFSKMPPDGGLDRFQATFSLAQRRRNPSNVVASLLTTQTLLVPRSAHSSVGSSISRESDSDSSFPVPLLHRDHIHSDILTPPAGWMSWLQMQLTTSFDTETARSTSITALQHMTQGRTVSEVCNDEELFIGCTEIH